MPPAPAVRSRAAGARRLALPLVLSLGAAGAAAAQPARTIDVTLTKQASTYGGGVFDLRVVFSEDAVGLALNDFSATNASVGFLRSATGSPVGDLRAYLVEVTPAASGTITIKLRGGAARTPVTSARDSRAATWVWDREGPKVTISGPASIQQDSDLSFPTTDFTVRFDEALGYTLRLTSRGRFAATNGKVLGVTATTANPPVLTVAVRPTAVGTLTLSVPAGGFRDRTGNTNAAASKSSTVSAYVPPNRPPVVTAPSDKSFSQGETITAFDIEASDPDDDALTVGVTGLPSGLSYSASSGQVSGTVAADAAVKDYTATITANDGEASEVSATFTVTVTRANGQPVITVPADRTYSRGETISTFAIEVSDPDKDSTTVGVSGLPPGLNWQSAVRWVSGTIGAEAAVKDYTVTITANDGIAAEVRATFTITVKEAATAEPPQPLTSNSAPVITVPDDRAYRRGETITAFDIEVSDPDQDSVTVGVSGLPSGLSYSASTGKVSGTVAADAAIEDYTATIAATDKKAGEVNATFTVTVHPANRAPTIKNPGDQSYRQGEQITAFAIEVSDADSDSPTVGVSGLPTGLSYSASSGKVSGTVAADAAIKDYTATITADDGRAPVVSATFTVTVTRANRAPTITDPGDKSYRQGEQITAFAIEVSDADSDSPTVGVSGLPTGLSYSASSGKVSGTVAADAAIKDYTATITADDSRAPEVSATFTVTVTRANRAPTITGPGNKSYRQGEQITTFAIAVSDADSDSPTVGVSGLPSGLSYSASTGKVSGTVAADAALKDYTATITADDGRAPEVSATFTVTVTRANRAPTITGPGDKSYRQGETITAFAIEVSDADSDSPTVGVSGLPTGLSYSASSGKVSGTVAADAAIKDYTATITADDGRAPEVSATFTVTVTRANRPPTLTVPEAQTYAQGETIANESVGATDPDGDTLSLGVTGLPAGLSCSPNASAPAGTAGCSLTGTVAADAEAKNYTAAATANDGGKEVSATFTITVTETATAPPAGTPSNVSPVISAPADRTYTQGETITAFAISVSDNDGDTPTVAVTGLPSGLAYTASTGQVSGTVAADAAVKDYTATITANDGKAAEVSATFTITVARANREPVVTTPGDLTVAPGETIRTRSITAADADDDPLSLSVTGLPAGLACSAHPSPGNGSAGCDLKGTVAADAEAKDYGVTATVADGKATVGRTFTITVTEPAPPQPNHRNSAPAIAAPADRAYEQGEAIAAFSIPVTDPDDDPVTVTVAGLPAGLAYSASGGTVSGVVADDAQAAAYPVTIRADDGVNAAVSAAFTITITAAAGNDPGEPVAGNSPPVIAAPSDRIYSRGQTIAALPISVTDPDRDRVAVAVSGLPAGLAYRSGAVRGVVAEDAEVKAHRVTISAEDGVNPPAAAGFTITVHTSERSDGNRPPQVLAPGDRTFSAGESVSAFYAAVTDDDGDALAVTLRGLPRGLTHRTTTHRTETTVTDIEFSGTVTADPGRYPVTIRAADGVHGPITGSFTVTVREPGKPGDGEPRPLLFSRIRGPDLLYRVGRRIEPEVLPQATGGVGLVTYAVTPTLPDGLLFDGAERELTGTPTTKQRQTGYRLTATDEAGDRATLRFTITIVDPPVVTALRITSRPQRGHTYRRDEVVEVAADFSDRIEVEGTPALTLGVGGRPRTMEFAGAEAASLRFRYRVARRDLDPNGVSIEANALSLASGRLTDSLGTEADLSHDALPDQPAHRVNGAPEGSLPVLASLKITSRPRRDRIYRSGELIEAEARYREAVGPDEVPLLALRIGRDVRQMSLVEHRDSTFVYRYRVVPVDHDPNGVSLAANAVPTGAGWLAEAFDAAAASVYAVLPDQPDHRVDGAPQAVGTLPALRLTLGAAPARVPLEGAFRGAAGYTAESSAPAVAAVTLEGEALVVTPRADGSATVTVTGRNAGGDSTHSFGVTVVTADAEIAVVGGAFAGLGRSALSSAAASIGARLRETGGASAVHLAGRPAPDEAASLSGFGTGAAGFARRLPDSFSSDSFSSGPGPGTETAATAGSDSGSLFEQLMAGSAFSLTGTDLTGTDLTGGMTGDPTGAPADGSAGENGSGRRWTFWGAGDRQSFEGGAGSTYDGAPLTAYLGADLAVGRVLAGLAWSASRAETQYDFHDTGADARGSGDLSTRLLGLHPYLRWSPDERTDFWGIGGVGRGSAELSRSVTAAGEQADLGLVFGLAGVRRELASGRRGRLALRFDAGAARLSAEGGGAVLDGMAARVFRTRLGVEVSRSFGAATPFVVVDALYDGGDGATGAGVEIAGGLRAASAGGRAGIEARGRVLALHGESGYRETGASLTFRLGPARNEKGLALDLTPAWGEAPDDFSVGSGAGLSSGSRSLGGPGRGLTTMAGAAPETGGSLGARASYRLGAAAPFTEIRWEQSRSRQARVGLRLGRRDGRFGLDLLGERQEARDRPALFRFGLFGRVEF